MANIKINLNRIIGDGSEAIFIAPCDCSEITGLKVHHIGVNGNNTSTEFTFKDVHGNDLSSLDNLFAKGAYIKVILNVTDSAAYIQNADTNAYLEQRFEDIVSDTEKAIQDAIDGIETGDTPIGNASQLDGHDSDYFATAESVANLENGTTPVGNANKLGGKGASEYALASQLTFKSMPTGTDLNDCTEQGFYYFDGYAYSYTNTPNSDAHNGLMCVYRHSADRIEQAYYSINAERMYTRNVFASTVSNWKEIATTADLANYLPKSGITQNINPVSDLNSFFTGVGLFQNTTNAPSSDWWLIISGGTHGTVTQIAFDLFNTHPPKTRKCAGGTWYDWNDLTVGLANYAEREDFFSGDNYVFMQTDKEQAINGVIYRLILSNGTVLLGRSPDKGNTWETTGTLATIAELANYQNKDDVRDLETLFSSITTPTDIRAIMYNLPSGHYTCTTTTYPNVTFPFANGVGTQIEWERLKHANGYYYGTLTITSMVDNSQWATCSVYNNSEYTEWQSFLPKSGGAIGVGNTTIPFGVKGADGSSFINYLNHDDTFLGFLGMNGANKPSYMPADRSTSYDLLHSGNFSGYALPIWGGTLNEKACVNFKAPTTTNASGSYFINNDGTTFGGIGMFASGGVGQALYLAAGTTAPYDGANGLWITSSNIMWKAKSLHHDGNSAKVAIQSTAPTDTSALWVVPAS